MVNDFDTLKRVIAHVEAWHLDDGRIQTIRLAGEPIVRMRDDDVVSFLPWANHLSQVRVHVADGATRSVITATGLILCGRRITVVVDVRADLVRRHGLAGAVSVEAVSLLLPKAVAV